MIKAFLSRRGCVVVQRFEDKGYGPEAVGGIEVWPNEQDELVSEVKDKMGMLSALKLIEREGVPPIDVVRTSEGYSLSQKGINCGIILRLPEGIELLKMKIEKAMQAGKDD